MATDQIEWNFKLLAHHELEVLAADALLAAEPEFARLLLQRGGGFDARVESFVHRRFALPPRS